MEPAFDDFELYDAKYLIKHNKYVNSDIKRWPEDPQKELDQLPERFKFIHEWMDNREKDVAAAAYKSLILAAKKQLRQLKSVEELKGKDMALMIGLLGCGKSTVCQAIVKGTESLHMDEDEGVYEMVTPEDQAVNHHG